MTTRLAAEVVLDADPLRVEDLIAIVKGAHVVLGPTARDLIARSRAVVDALVDGETLIYGLNTGLGHMRNQRVPRAELEIGQLVTVRAHASGIGDPLPPEVVRAAMVVRLAGFARGGSGVTPAVADAYVAMLNAGVTPVVPTVGSVGAADLMHMAAIALVAMGEGRAIHGGEELPGAEALARAGIEPVRLGPKDGLTVISANGASIGHAALVVDRAARLADAADVVAAVTFEAAQANLSVVDPGAVAAKPVPAQAVAAARIRGLLEGSALCTGAPSVQDPLSFRVAPQVHGAFRETLGFTRDAVEQELAAMDDNPVVSLGDGRMISNGNFHPLLMALAVDSLRPAIAHVAQLSDRRGSHLWDELARDPEAFTPAGFDRLGMAPLYRWSSAARIAELRTIAGPATLDVPPLDLGVEDHSTNAPLAVRRTDEALGHLADILAIELLSAMSLIRWRDARDRMAPATRRVLEGVESVVASLGPGAGSEAVHAAARAHVESSLPAVEAP